MPILELHNDSMDGLRVHATMMFPQEEQLRLQCFSAMVAWETVADAEASRAVTLSAATLRVLLDAPSLQDLRAMWRERTGDAIVAGDLLSVLYVMSVLGMDEPSMNKAVHACQEFAKHRVFGDGTPMNVSERMIRESWARFESVAHIWAALRLNEGAYPFADRTQIFADDLGALLAVAAGIERFATAFAPMRSKSGPLLKQADVWSIPSAIVPLDLRTDQIPNPLASYLKTYRAPRSL